MMLTNTAWLGVLEEAIEVRFDGKMDSIDISYSELGNALKGFTDREIKALEARYGDKLTLKEVGIVIGPVNPARARQILCKAIRKFRQPWCVRKIRVSIAAYWHLNSEWLKYDALRALKIYA